MFCKKDKVLFFLKNRSASLFDKGDPKHGSAFETSHNVRNSHEIERINKWHSIENTYFLFH